MQIAYLVNQYPKVSHSFIRREIHALERQGFRVLRVALRGWDGDLVDAEDAQERALTRYVLRDGAGALTAAVLRAFARAPGRFLTALATALRLARRADRPLPYHLVYLAEACRVLEWLREAGATHLHAHFGTNPAEVALLVQALGGPAYSFTVHGPEEFDKPQALKLGEKVAAARFVAAVSSFGRSQLLRWTGHEHWHRVQVVRCGLEPGYFEGAEVPVPQAPRLVCVGRICEQKGQLLLVEALHRLRARGVAAELVLAGDGEMRAQVEALAARLGVAGQLRVTGWIDAESVRREILAARALVLPSFAEGLPVVLMESLALRRPVISTYVAGIPELVVPGENGWLVPAGDVDALAAAMHACLQAPADQLAAMGAAGHARARQRHHVDTEAARLAALFTQGEVAAP